MVTNVYNSILDIADRYEGILLDAYGVFWAGNAMGTIPGAAEAMEQLVASGKVVGVLSNSTARSAAEIDKVSRKGLLLRSHFHFFITSGDVSRDIFVSDQLPFATPAKKFFLFGGVHPRYGSPYALFEDSAFTEAARVEEADFIYIPTPHLYGDDQTDPELFRAAVEAVAPHKLPMVCANPDRFAHEGSPARAVVRQGSIAALYEQCGGSVFYIGKPSPLSFAAAMTQFKSHGVINPANVLMVGDTPETDILGAKQFGMGSALVLDTGMMKERSDRTLSATHQPDYYIRRLNTCAKRL